MDWQQIDDLVMDLKVIALDLSSGTEPDPFKIADFTALLQTRLDSVQKDWSRSLVWVLDKVALDMSRGVGLELVIAKLTVIAFSALEYLELEKQFKAKLPEYSRATSDA
jgi:hypothetical protein